MTPKALQSCTRRWQRMLGLQDWTIRVSYVRRASIDGAWGRTSWDLNHRHAVVQIADPIDVPEEEVEFWGPELTVVHELVHVVLAWCVTTDSTEETLLEQAVNALASGLLGSTSERQNK